MTNKAKVLRMLCGGGLSLCLLLLTGDGAAASRRVPRIAFGFEGQSGKGVYVTRVDGKGRRKVSHGLKAGSGGYTPSWSGDGSRIAFAGTQKDGPSKIFTVRPDGSGQQRVSKGATCAGDTGPDWSSHSQHIVFERAYCDPTEVWSVSRYGRQLRRLSDSSDHRTVVGGAPQWSPDGNSIAFYRDDQDLGYDVWVMDRDGGAKRRLTSYGDEVDPRWSPDSTSLVYTQVTSGTRSAPDITRVCTVDVSSGPSSATCVTNSGAIDNDPHYSPSGNRIVFVTNRSTNKNICVMEADGSEQHAIAHTPAYEGQPEWSPDGRWIVFLSKRSGHMDVYVVHPDGTGLRRLTNDPGVEDAPTWAP
jgi:Tol biopolymer transport system component